MGGIFITGTDTGVGKTFVGGGIAAYLNLKGIKIGVMKPLESGCKRVGGRLIPRDAIYLKRLSGCPEPLFLINPYNFKSPLAPAMAAEREGVRIEPEKIKKIYDDLSRRYPLVLVEGAGGLLVPVWQDYLMIHLASDMGLKLLIVSLSRLGTINHTLMTVKVAMSFGLEIVGIVINRRGARPTLAEKTGPKIIAKLSGQKILGVFPNRPQLAKRNISREELANFISRYMDLKPIEEVLY